MNHCRDCNSDYAMPGTCNCFAPGGKRHAEPAQPFIPYDTMPWPQPSTPWVPTPAPGTLPVGPYILGPCSICGKYGCKEMHITITSTSSAAGGSC